MDDWKRELAGRLGIAADLLDCALLVGGVEGDEHAEILDRIVCQVRSLVAEARFFEPRDPSDSDDTFAPWFAEELRTLGESLERCVRSHQCADPQAQEDLDTVLEEVWALQVEAEWWLRTPRYFELALGGGQ